MIKPFVEEEIMTTERRSSVTTAGDRRAPNRSMLRAMRNNFV